MICDGRISILFVCFCVSRFVACDRNYDWWQRKTQLSRGLLNFGVCMFVKSAVKHGLLKFFEYLCTLNTLQTRTQSLDRLNWESNSPEAENKEQKSHAKTKTRHFPILLRINVASILSNIEVVINVRVSRKYINQPLAKSSLILCYKILQKKWQLQKVFTKSWLLGHRGV